MGHQLPCKPTKFDVAIFNELVEDDSKEKTEDAWVIVCQVDDPGDGSQDRDQQPVKCRVW